MRCQLASFIRKSGKHHAELPQQATFATANRASHVTMSHVALLVSRIRFPNAFRDIKAVLVEMLPRRQTNSPVFAATPSVKADFVAALSTSSRPNARNSHFVLGAGVVIQWDVHTCRVKHFGPPELYSAAGSWRVEASCRPRL